MFKGNKIATKVNDELENSFFVQDVMDALGVVYPYYSLKFTCEETFLVHMDVLKGFYY
jgi:hypothetical protein